MPEMEANTPSLLRGAAAGLVAGLVASFAMDRFQAVVAAMSPPSGDSEPATDKTADAISRAVAGHELAKPDKPFGGQIVHYGLGGCLGAIYGVAAEYRHAVTTGYGTVFGAGVAAALDETVVPALDLAEPPWRSGMETHVFSLASHLVFGAVAEFTRRQIRSTL